MSTHMVEVVSHQSYYLYNHNIVIEVAGCLNICRQRIFPLHWGAWYVITISYKHTRIMRGQQSFHMRFLFSCPINSSYMDNFLNERRKHKFCSDSVVDWPWVKSTRSSTTGMHTICQDPKLPSFLGFLFYF